jgi:hypothetical protein
VSISLKEKPVVAVDLDGVLAAAPPADDGTTQIGPPIPGAKEFLAALREFAQVLIYTGRVRYNPFSWDGKGYRASDSLELICEMVERVKNWLHAHGMPYDAVWTGTGKPSAAAFIDDRGVSCRPERPDAGDPAYEYRYALSMARWLCKQKENLPPETISEKFEHLAEHYHECP